MMSYQVNPLFAGSVAPSPKVHTFNTEQRSATPFSSPARHGRNSLSGYLPKAIPKHMTDFGHNRSSSSPFIQNTGSEPPVKINLPRPLHKRAQSLGVNSILGNTNDAKADSKYLDLPAGFVPAVFHETYLPSVPRISVEAGTPETIIKPIPITPKNSPPLSSQPLPATQINDFLAYDEFERKIAYNILFAPIHKYRTTIVDPNTRKAFPPRKLSEAATSPPVSELVLQTPLLPWKIKVRPQIAEGKVVTNNDIFYAIHAALHVSISSAEWERLGSGSKMQEKTSEAFRRRCKLLETEIENGIKRVDLLGGKTMFAGIETKPNGTHELILSI